MVKWPISRNRKEKFKSLFTCTSFKNNNILTKTLFFIRTLLTSLSFGEEEDQNISYFLNFSLKNTFLGFPRWLQKMVEGQVLMLSGQGHLLGHPAAIVARQVLLGRKVVVVCCEGISISGNFYRNKLKNLAFLRKWMNTTPSWGPHHFPGTTCIFWQTV